jgi:SulP family sulfate permease
VGNRAAAPAIDRITAPTAAPEPPPAPRSHTPWLYRRVPALDSLRTYSLRALGADAMAGLTVAAIAMPQAMAYALLAGLPPQYGLYTAIVVTAVGALFDSSYQLINGPTNAISIALLTVLAVVPEDQRVAAAVLFAGLVGLIQLGITVLRLGDLSRYVSHSVIVGFTLGAGVLLVLDQFKHLVGLAPRGRPEDHFLKRFWLSLTEGGSWNLATTLVGVGTIVLVLAVRRLNDALRRRGVRFPIPQHLAGVALMALLVWAFDLGRQGVHVVGTVPTTLPRFEVPEFRWDWVQQFLGNAFGVAILGLLEAVAMAKAIAAHTGQRLNINQQCLSEGMANLAGSFFQCMPGSGSLTRSTVNRQAGAVSQWSGVFAAAAVAGTVVLFAPLAGHIPRASLAGLLLLAAFRMVDRKQLLFHLRATRFDAGIVLATALAAVFVSVEFCILVGVFLSFVLYVPRAAQVRLTELVVGRRRILRERTPADPPAGPIRLFELEGDLSFGAAIDLERHLAHIEKAAADQTQVLLFLQRARNPDAAFLGLLERSRRRLHERHVALVLCGVQPDLARALTDTGLDVEFGADQDVRAAECPEPLHPVRAHACTVFSVPPRASRPGGLSPAPHTAPSGPAARSHNCVTTEEV